jgi:hypothetical protein
MTTLMAWVVALSVGILCCFCLGSVNDVWSCLAAASIVWISFLITTRFKVAGRHTVSKMGTAWLSQEVRRMVWRMLLTLTLAALAFRLMYPTWGMAFWLCVAGFYQVSLFLHLRDIRRRPLTSTTPGHA